MDVLDRAGGFKKHIPNMLTTMNFLCGLHVVLLTVVRTDVSYRPIACGLLFLAAFLDAIDVKVARYLKAESELGKQLDSFADYTSFGLAPMALLLTHPTLVESGWFIYVGITFYMAAGAFRLSRYNVKERSHYFTGLPIPAAGVSFTIVNLLLHFTPLVSWSGTPTVVSVLLLIAAFLMASRVKVRGL